METATGTLVDILWCPNAGETLNSHASAKLLKDCGIEGDRYCSRQGTFSEALEENGDFQLTLIDEAHIQAFNQVTGQALQAADFRRNLVVRGLDLNQLVDREFQIGDVRVKGIRLCEPCGYLAGLLGDTVMEHMIHKAGLRAVVLSDGLIHRLDAVTPV